MGGGVDAGGEAADDRDARPGEIGRELPGHAAPVLARPTGADDGDRDVVLRDERATDGEHERRIRDLAEAGRITVVGPDHERGTRGSNPRRFARRTRRRVTEGLHDGVRETRLREQPRRRGQHVFRRAEARHELVRVARRQLLNEAQREPGRRVAGASGS